MPDERRRRLKELEAVIQHGWAEVVRVGQALREIRDQGLYLELDEGLTFEGYCRTRWALPKASAYRKIDAAEIDAATSQIRDAVPIATEAVASELAPLLRSGGATKVAEAWTKVSAEYRGQRPPTAREVHKVLMREGYRPRIGSVSSGKPNARILLGQVGDRIHATEKRLDWYLEREVPGLKVGSPTRQLAVSYAARCQALADRLRAFAEESEP